MFLNFEFQQTVAIPSYANVCCKFIGLDSQEHCLDSAYFRSYPDDVEYRFNEIGYRTKSVNEFRGNEILAIGDSFTLGLGVPLQHTWPCRLEQLLNYPVLNFSLNGASNDWLARKTQQLLQWFQPRAIVVHYTFSHRRERPCPDWHDDERTECEPFYTEQENLENWNRAFCYFSSLPWPVVHSFIPNWHTTSIDHSLLNNNVLPPTQQIDFARDRFHYGVKTNQQLAESITNLLARV